MSDYKSFVPGTRDAVVLDKRAGHLAHCGAVFSGELVEQERAKQRMNVELIAVDMREQARRRQLMDGFPRRRPEDTSNDPSVDPRRQRELRQKRLLLSRKRPINLFGHELVDRARNDFVG